MTEKRGTRQRRSGPAHQVPLIASEPANWQICRLVHLVLLLLGGFACWRAPGASQTKSTAIEEDAPMDIRVSRGGLEEAMVGVDDGEGSGNFLARSRVCD